VGGRAEEVVDAACGLELIHTYSLIHDDLPAMDDDALRRGRPTTHVRFGEATAILAGDALLPLAFEILATSPFPAERVVRASADLARAVGAAGMVAGQDLDLAAEGRRISHDELERIHRLKTGALLEASLRLGALLGGGGDDDLEALTRYGGAIGLAFQVVDDLLDVEEDAETLGKNPGDEAREKSTYPALLGVEPSRSLAGELAARARAEVQSFGEPGRVLAALADFVVERRS
jgi:geranylgeranyl pyrophosphate synthase